MQAVSREDGGLAVDVVQRYLHAWQRADTHEIASKRKHECEVERRAAIAIVHWRVDLEVGPRIGGRGQRSKRDEYKENARYFPPEEMSLHNITVTASTTNEQSQHR